MEALDEAIGLRPADLGGPVLDVFELEEELVGMLVGAVLERVHRGESHTAIARVTGHSRKTVRRYLATAREVGWEPERDPPTEALAAEVYRRHRPAKERGPGEAEAELLPYLEQLRTWLTPGPGEKRGLKLTKVQRLLERQGIRIPYSSLHRFVVKHCDFGRKGRVTVRMAPCAPGELAEVDFGRLGRVRDPETGRSRVAWALVVVLVHSRHQYVHVTYSQRLRDVIDGLEDAWHFFGGVPRRVILDNLKPAVTKADRYDPVFQRTCGEYARFRGFVLDATRSADPQGKPHVERGVPYVRENFFRGESWLGLDQVQREARRWCLETAGTRVHGTTRERPLAVFENVERRELLPLQGERFDPPEWGQYKVHPDHHISLQRALYSVPHAHLGRTVWVRTDRKLVRIYVDGTLVKTHARQPPGGRATDHADYPAELTPYTLRDPERMIRLAQSQGADLGRFMEALLSGTVPWDKLRQAQKLLRLGTKYGWGRVNVACRRALAFELVNVRRVESILLQELDQLPLPLDSGIETPVLPIQLRFQQRGDEEPVVCSIFLSSGTMENVSWSFSGGGHSLSDLGSGTSLSGMMAVSGTVTATATVDGEPLSGDASITVTARDWSSKTYPVTIDDVGNGAPGDPNPLPPVPMGFHHFGDFLGRADPAGDATSVIQPIPSGPNKGLAFLTDLPPATYWGEIRLNEVAFTTGSEFLNAQNDCTVSELQDYFNTEVKAHEGLNFEPMSHAAWFRDKLDQIVGELHEKIVGEEGMGILQVTSSTREEARFTAHAHAASLHGATGGAGLAPVPDCDVVFPLH